MSDIHDPEKASSQDAHDILNDKDALKTLHIEHVHTLSAADWDRVQKVRNAAYAAAIKQGNLNPWSRNSFILYACCFTAFLCSCANGYDGSLMTGINIMPYYQARFTDSTLGATTGLIFCMYTIGQLCAPWFAGPISDKLGRRGGMFIGGIIICLGSAIITSAPSRPQFLAGRFILGFGVSIMTTAAPSYCIEICPPQWRGRMTGFYNCGWFGGSIPAAGIILGTSSLNNDLSWRIPLIIQCVPSAIVVLVVWFLPESPRWLLANGKDQKAREFLVRFHGNNDPTNAIVELEWAEFKTQIAVDASDKRSWDYSELYNSPSARWRSLMVLLMGVFGQFSGNGLGYFNTQIYEMVGYDTYMQWVLNLCGSFTSAFGAGCGVALADKMPRRLVLVWGTLVSAALLAINGGLSAKWAATPADEKDLNVGRGAVASYFFFGIVYSFAYTPLQALYPVECLQTTARAKGMAMYAFVVGAISFVNLYCTPIALQNISYNYIFIFVGWDVIESILWHFLCVETVGRTLEELEDIFSTHYPPGTSKRVQKIGVKESGEVVVADE